MGTALNASLKRFRGRRTKTSARASVFLTCFALLLSGLTAPGPAGAQVTPDRVMSLKDVPVPNPMAAVISGSIPDSGTDLDFKPLTADMVKSQSALVRLGKALFWDMQVGSDGIQACASCHFNAGADIRSKNQISPGLKDSNFNGPLGGDGIFGESTVPYTANDPNSPNGPSEVPPAQFNVPGFPHFKPNYQLKAADFPLNDWFRTTDLTPRGPDVTFEEEFSNVSRDTNDVISSQGVRHTIFKGITSGSAVEKGTAASDIFNTSTPGKLNLAGKTRRVEPRNAPSVINAVFNYDNFWDGRASFIFNGVNPFGFRDQTSTLKENINGVLKDVFVRVTNSSLASQSVGPPTSNFEMSFEGRSFPDIGKKMVSLRPLAKQLVHPRDSVLGASSRAALSRSGTVVGAKGLKAPTYADMIKAAFKDSWWSGTDIIRVDTATNVVQKASPNDPRKMVLSPGKTTVIPRAETDKGLAANEYTQMEFNFSLFFGLAVQAYEATLVSDDTPFDRFMGSLAPVRENNGKPIPPDPSALTEQQSLGLSIFTDTDPILGARCVSCHTSPVTSGHTVLEYQPDGQGVPSLDSGEPIEFMIMGDNQEEANYDHGMYNIAVRRTSEDAGRAGTAPFINPLTGQPFPLSLVELAALRQDDLLPGDVARFVPDIPILPRRVTNGAFKVPNLRNSKFTGPYFHNGDSATLRQVVEFYIRGGNFPNTDLHDLPPDIDGIAPMMFPEFDPVAEQNIEALVSFIADGLNDPRVAMEKAPFDHPQLMVPNGASGAASQTDLFMNVPAVGQNGRSKEIPTFLNLDPQKP